MNYFGKGFLEASVGPVIRKLIAQGVVIEVDPVRSGKGVKDHEKHVDLLCESNFVVGINPILKERTPVNWCSEFWSNIYSVREVCPQ